MTQCGYWGTYLISALISNYFMVFCEAPGPGVHQMSTVIKFYFTKRASGRPQDLRVFDFYKFSTPRLNCQSGGMELSLGARLLAL